MAADIARGMGLLDVDELVVDCFPNELPDEVSPELSHLRVRHLLSMTVGQEQSWLMGASRPRMETPDWVRFCLAQRFECEPGTRLRYTNVGPYLAGILVARRAGTTLADFWYEYILRPQGFFRPSVEVDPLGNTFGAGGLMVTTEHLLALGRTLLTRDGLVPDDWIDYVQQPGCEDVYPQVDGDYRYGSGFWLHPNGCYLADGKFGQVSVVMQEKGAVLALTSDCETPHETLKAFWETVYPTL